MSARRAASGTHTRQRGAAAVEFQIISIMVLIPLLLGVIQLGLLMIAKNTVNVATLGAARAGAASGGDKDAMKHALMLGLAPLFASSGKLVTGVGMSDIGSVNYAAVMAATLARTKLEMGPFARITVLNPTAKSFADFGVDKPGVGRVIPVTNVMDSNAVGGASGQTRPEALLLKIEVRYCHQLQIPLISDLILKVLNAPLSGASLEDRICYLARRVPIKSQAVVHMTVSPVRGALL